MDVGLNNRNKLTAIHKNFADVVFLVEANNTEYYYLWQEWCNKSISNITPLSDESIDKLLRPLKDQILYKDQINPTMNPLKAEVLSLNRKVKENFHPRVEWKEEPCGFNIQIGKVKKMPVCVEFRFANINGKKICFYYCTSQMADYRMVEKFLITRFQLTHDGYTRWNHVDAMNFHNCIQGLSTLDKKPRNTKYKVK